MSIRQFGFHLALFACAYAGFFFASKPVGAGLPPDAGANAVGIETASTKNLVAGVPARDSPTEGPSARRSVDPERAPGSMAVTPEMQAAAQRLSEQAVSAEESEDRLNAMQNLSVLPEGLAVPTLQQVLRQSSDKRERLRAVAILQQLGAQGDPDSQIESILRDAASDADEHVAAIARDAWEHLSRR